MTKNNLQKALEESIEGLLEIINSEWNETISRNDELFFEHQALLSQYDLEKAKEYSLQYNDIAMTRSGLYER